MHINSAKDMVHICSIGECMVELSGYSETQNCVNLGFAGDTMNTAVHLSRQLDPERFEVSYLTRLGQDKFSDQAIRFLSKEGIQTNHIGRDANRNIGIYSINLDDEGERSFTYWRSQSAAREMFGKGVPALPDLGAFDVIFLSAITLAVLPPHVRTALTSACAAAHAQGRVVAFDSNYRPTLWESAEIARQTIDEMWASCSIAMPSLDDEQKLHPNLSPDQIVDRIAAFGVSEIVLKSGSNGPKLWPKATADSFRIADTVMDTTGAGDAFDAGYLAARLTGKDQVTAAHAGHELASDVISKPGAIETIENL